MSKKILIILAHPNIKESKSNSLLLSSVKEIPSVKVRELYQLYPDFKISPENIQEEQNLLKESDSIVFQFPLFWYSSPALLKEWMDKVFTYGFAFGGDNPALKNKTLQIVTTAGGPREAYAASGYNKFTLSELLRPYEQTANLCSMKYLTPFAMYGVMKSTEKEKLLVAEEYRMLIQSFKSTDPI